MKIIKTVLKQPLPASVTEQLTTVVKNATAAAVQQMDIQLVWHLMEAAASLMEVMLIRAASKFPAAAKHIMNIAVVKATAGNRSPAAVSAARAVILTAAPLTELITKPDWIIPNITTAEPIAIVAMIRLLPNILRHITAAAYIIALFRDIKSLERQTELVALI